MTSLQHIINNIGLKDAMNSLKEFHIKKEINIYFDTHLLYLNPTYFKFNQQDYIDYQCDYIQKRVIEITYNKIIYRRNTC